MSAYFFELDPPALEQWCAEHDLPRFAAAQIIDWVYRKGVIDPLRMSNISRRHQESLAAAMTFDDAHLLTEQLASDGTRKLLLHWRSAPGRPVEDAVPRDLSSAASAVQSGLTVLSGAPRSTECVMIPAEERRTACVSSQVGCPVGCRFCASGLGGLEGNLRFGQIVEQVHRLGRNEPDRGITNVVFMGMGEPLANYAAVTDAIRHLTASWGMGLGARRITISTVGLPAAIRKLVEFDLPVTLALSLHAPEDGLRRELIPWAQYTTIDELIGACDEYFRATGREITFEYILLRRVNDRPEHARQLAALARRIRANVNLIRYNEVAGLPYERPTNDDVHRFQDILREERVNTHIRRSRGRDIAAACGQLRRQRAAEVTG